MNLRLGGLAVTEAVATDHVSRDYDHTKDTKRVEDYSKKHLQINITKIFHY